MPYKVTTIRNFKGLSQNLALTAGAPEFALNCVNVIPSAAGLAKLRVPTELSDAPVVSGTGPEQFAMYEGGSTKLVLAFFGTYIYEISLDDFTLTAVDSNADYVGPVPWSVILSNNFGFMQNGLSIPLKCDGTSTLQYWGIQEGGVPTLGVPAGTGITLTSGRQYRIAYKNDTTEHVGTASSPSASTGAITDDYIPVTIPAPPGGPDPQITSAKVYATLDGASDYFLHSTQTGSFPLTFNDSTLDEDLDQSERAPLINDTPPIAKYMCLWGGRIFMFNLVDENTKWVAYTGYNRIYVGRPEESCPPGNRIKLETGADDISGGGVIAAGVIAFDRSNKMFMFRGQPEDITVTAPVEFGLVMKQLPWQIGCASHFTIASTSRGLIWLTPDLDVLLFNGQDEPESIAEGVEPILRRINFESIENSRAVLWQYKKRNWYVLAVPLDNDTQLSQLIVMDLEKNPEKNVGCFPFDVGKFDSLGVVEMTNGEQKLVIGQEGMLKELTVTSTTINGIEDEATSTTDTLGAYWQSGYFGNDSPEVEKFCRWGRVTADASGVRVKRRLIGDDVTVPTTMEFEDVPTGGKVATNKKARRISYELRFADLDRSQNILELTDVQIPLAQR